MDVFFAKLTFFLKKKWVSWVIYWVDISSVTVQKGENSGCDQNYFIFKTIKSFIV